MHSQMTVLKEMFDPINGGIQGLRLSSVNKKKTKQYIKGRSVCDGECAQEPGPPRACTNHTQGRPLVLHMYNHKKATENVTKRIQYQIKRDKNRRALYKKVLSPQSTPRNISPRKYPSPEWGGPSNIENRSEIDSGHFDETRTKGWSIRSENCRDAYSKEIARNDPIDGGKRGNYQFQTLDSFQAQRSNQDFGDGSGDSKAIISVSSSNRGNIGLDMPAANVYNQAKYVLPPLHGAHSGYILRNNKIFLTKKLAPPSTTFSPTYHHRSTPSKSNTTHSSHPSFLWANMDAGTLPWIYN